MYLGDLEVCYSELGPERLKCGGLAESDLDSLLHSNDLTANPDLGYQDEEPMLSTDFQERMNIKQRVTIVL